MGAALLISESSQLDKRRRSGSSNPQSSAPGLQFIPLRDIEEIDVNVRGCLRDMQVNPPMSVYVGSPIGGGIELYGNLFEAYPVPHHYFGMRMQDFGGHPDADPADPSHVVVERHDTRIGHLDPGQLELLKVKMLAYWAKVRGG